MRTITAKQAGSVEQTLLLAFPKISRIALRRALRKRDVKLDGKRLPANHMVSAGDVLEVFIADEMLFTATQLDVAYEDDRILAVNKPAGISVTPDPHGGETLTDRVGAYLAERGFFDAPIPCHRLDHFTGGITLFAKDMDAYAELAAAFKDMRAHKLYRCLTRGTPTPREDELRAWLRKDAQTATVRVLDHPAKDAVTLITRYRVLEPGDICALEVQPLTGRTHQIRAHLAHIGHPIIGDDKYGDRELNKALREKHQKLWATELSLEMPRGELSYLNGRRITAECPF